MLNRHVLAHTMPFLTYMVCNRCYSDRFDVGMIAYNALTVYACGSVLHTWLRPLCLAW
jgi:hypothetical protein